MMGFFPFMNFYDFQCFVLWFVKENWQPYNYKLGKAALSFHLKRDKGYQEPPQDMFLWECYLETQFFLILLSQDRTSPIQS